MQCNSENVCVFPKEVCHRYWPQGKGSPEEFGQFSVTITSQDIQTVYIMQKMDVAEMANESKTNKFSVIHIQYLQWSEGGVPSTTATVLEIADLVQKIQMSTGNRPVVVMCKYVERGRDWLAGWLAGCLAGWLPGWLVWLAGWLADSAGWLWLASWLPGWLVAWLAGLVG